VARRLVDLDVVEQRASLARCRAFHRQEQGHHDHVAARRVAQHGRRGVGEPAGGWADLWIGCPLVPAVVRPTRIFRGPARPSVPPTLVRVAPRYERGEAGGAATALEAKPPQAARRFGSASLSGIFAGCVQAARTLGVQVIADMSVTWLSASYRDRPSHVAREWHDR
jgi:hypothetical protein